MQYRNIFITIVIYAIYSSANAAPIKYNLHSDGFNGSGILQGSFFAEDLNLDGKINSQANEITDFQFSFTGDSIVNDINLNQTDLLTNNDPLNIYTNTFLLLFEIDDDMIIDGDSTNNIVSILFHEFNENGNLASQIGLSTGVLSENGNCLFANGCTNLERSVFTLPVTPILESSSQSPIVITAVPLPASVVFFITALVSLINMRNMQPR